MSVTRASLLTLEAGMTFEMRWSYPSQGQSKQRGLLLQWLFTG